MATTFHKLPCGYCIELSISALRPKSLSAFACETEKTPVGLFWYYSHLQAYMWCLPIPSLCVCFPALITHEVGGVCFGFYQLQ